MKRRYLFTPFPSVLYYKTQLATTLVHINIDAVAPPEVAVLKVLQHTARYNDFIHFGLFNNGSDQR